MTRTTAQPFKPGKSKKAPRMKHSPFGDYPKEKMPKKDTEIEPPAPIENFAASIAIKGNSKWACFARISHFIIQIERI